jgi:hypothetical protein
MTTCDIIQGASGFRARLNDTEAPIAPWRAIKIEACRDIVDAYGPRVYVVDRTGAQPRADWHLFDILA